MTYVVLILAGPTPWDMEDRIVGNQSLPLTDAAKVEIEQGAKSLRSHASSVYRNKANEACDQAAHIVARTFDLRPHDNRDLDELNLGLWQGLTRAELKFRYPSAFPEWEENPLAVHPPDGELIPDAIERLHDGLRKILRRQRGDVVALALRPMAMQIVHGLLNREDTTAIAGHLHNTSAIETISIANDVLHDLIS